MHKLIITYDLKHYEDDVENITIPILYESLEKLIQDFKQELSICSNALNNRIKTPAYFQINEYKFYIFDFLTWFEKTENNDSRYEYSLPKIITLDQWFEENHI